MKQVKVMVTDEFGSTYSFVTDDRQYALQVVGQWLETEPFIEIVIQPEE